MKTAKLLLLAAALGGLLLNGACAAGKSAGGGQSAAKPGAAGPGDAKAPIQVGTDLITPLPLAKVWAVLAAVDNWGAWNPKVTKVQAGPGLNAGTAIAYGWEEREIRAVIQDVKEDELLAWKGTRTGKDVLLRWQLRSVGGNVLVSLRAVLKPNSGATPIANAGVETQAWMGALQVELTRLVETEKPVKKAKK